ncbi:peptidoglycan-binding protein [Nitratireductor luteus]|uniref:peptidoglycan-binding domain-containing protein n=1 Tax=Nitratireductor luteus TaxID=2976980 RepID=UPI0022401EC8|nr:peptidoglycan-binding protein [Nitratireductor luteus]
MTRYARQPDEHAGVTGWIAAGFAGLGSAMARNPMAVGGTTAFLISLAFVSANAIWYQPQPHPSAFIPTRAPVRTFAPAPDIVSEMPAPRTAPRDVLAVGESASQPSEPVAAGEMDPNGDPSVGSVQRVLGDLGLYRGPVDGMNGPQTRAAIENYRRIVGLSGGSEIDGPLLRQLGLGRDVVDISDVPAPKPAPRPQTGNLAENPATNPNDGMHTASVEGSSETVRRVQAGLKAFGNEGIEIDGMMGARTREAIREFQSLFGLPVTGEADEALQAKMREIGLTN